MGNLWSPRVFSKGTETGTDAGIRCLLHGKGENKMITESLDYLERLPVPVAKYPNTASNLVIHKLNKNLTGHTKNHLIYSFCGLNLFYTKILCQEAEFRTLLRSRDKRKSAHIALFAESLENKISHFGRQVLLTSIHAKGDKHRPCDLGDLHNMA